jgi:hypothetical protein
MRTLVLFPLAMSSQLGWDFAIITTVLAYSTLDDLNGVLLHWRRLTLFGDEADLGKRDVSDGIIFFLLEAEFLIWKMSNFYYLRVGWLITRIGLLL